MTNRLKRVSRHVRLPVYLGAILVLTLLTTASLLVAFDGFVVHDWRYWFFATIALIGASALGGSLVNMAITLLMPPRALPRLDFAGGIPEVHRSMVIVPCLLNSRSGIDDLVEALEIRYLGNRDPNLYFALLSDFVDAPEQTLPDDGALLAHARAAVEALNKTYQDDRPCIFYLLHRPRVWNPVERVWMGYERKRGKLEQFNNFVLGAQPDDFSICIGEMDALRQCRYVITLDADTMLPPGTAAQLVGTLAHPLNAAVYDEDTGRVASGYCRLR